MPNIVATQYPNSAIVAHAPGNTNWNEVARPASVPVSGYAVLLEMKAQSAAGSGTDGSTYYYANNSVSAPSVGSPQDGTLYEQVPAGQNNWIKLTTGTDVVYCTFRW